jgi:hypothetical protein
MRFEPEIIIPILLFMIPIVAILTKHQQKMVEMTQSGGSSNQTASEIYALREELRHQRELVTGLALSMDNLKQEMRNRDTSFQQQLKVNE